jgi:chromosome segregation ATPase
MATNESIETEIDKISGQLAVAERLKEYKATLEALLQKTKSAMEDYPVKKYTDLLKRWQDQDRSLKDLLAKLQCSITNWDDLLRQGVAPLFADIAALKGDLRMAPEGAEPAPGTGDGLYARRERQQLRLAHLQARYEKARLDLAAWEKPAPTLEKILNENDKLAADIKKTMGQPEAPALLYDMFFKLLPMHYLVAPPEAWSTRVNAKEFVIGCAGAQAWKDLKEMLGPQPMLIEPAKYLDHIVEGPLKEYNTAKTRLADAAGDLQKTQDEIKRAEKSLDEKRKTLDKAARAALLDAAAPVKQAHQVA